MRNHQDTLYSWLSIGRVSTTSNAAYIMIGDEILNGSVHDVNLPHLSTQLNKRGVQIKRVEIIPDEIEEIVNTVLRVSSQFHLVFTSGGIGPTHDDRTYEALSKAFHLPLKIDELSRSQLKSYLDQRGHPLNNARLRMVNLPHPATIYRSKDMWCPVVALENRIFVLAGVPSVFKKMLAACIDHLPVVEGQVMLKKNLYTLELEGAIADILSHAESHFGDLSIGSYPRDGLFINPLEGKSDIPSANNFNVRIALQSTNAASIEAAADFISSKILAISPSTEIR